MRYSSALVLSTLAVGQAAAANIRHAGFHARRAAEQRRGADVKNVDWSKVSYDLSGVDWSSVFATPTPTPAPSPKPEPSKAEVKVQAQPTSAYTPPAAKATEAAKPSHTKGSGDGIIGNLIGDVVDVFKTFQGVTVKWLDNADAKKKLNPTSNNGVMWLGDSGDWKTTFINDGDHDLVVVCWTNDGYGGSFINDNVPHIAVKLASGEQQTVSHGAGTSGSGACSPVYPGSGLTQYGQIKQTWYEFTYGENGKFDVSKEVYMGGVDFVAKGSMCTSDGDTCVFKCKNGMSTCEKTEDYELYNCGPQNGGAYGKDPSTGGASGGCNMGSNGEHVKVTFS